MTFMMVMFFQAIVISTTMVFITSGFIWVTQIIANIRHSSKDTPNMGYAISQQALISFIPLYIRGCPENLMQIKPAPTFVVLYSLAILI